jgi:hypothetical protein
MKEILDRAGIRGGIEIDQNVSIEVKPAAEVVRERLAKLREGAHAKAELEAKIYSGEEEAEVVAEVVEETVR